MFETKREFRIEAIKFLYLLEVGGEYEKELIDDEVFKTIESLVEHTDEIEEILNDKNIYNNEEITTDIIEKLSNLGAKIELKEI